jgi:hypothetical protein
VNDALAADTKVRAGGCQALLICPASPFADSVAKLLPAAQAD